MRVVLYDTGLEPITVLNLPAWATERLKAGEYIRFAVPPMIPATYYVPAPCYEILRIVTIWFEPLVRNGIHAWMAFTKEAEDALLLKSVFLPGQQSEVQRRERDAFYSGLLAELRR